MKELAEKTLAQLCLFSQEKYKDHQAFAMISEGAVVRSFTYNQLGNRALQVGSFLRSLGLQTGGRVMLFSENCPEWPMTYFGIALGGGVIVPLLTGFSSDQVKYISEHAEVNIICISKNLAANIEMENFKNTTFVYIDTITDDNNKIEVVVSVNGSEKVMALPPISECKNHFPDNCNELATLIYTSGTQGSSKGVMLSSKNIISSALSSLDYVQLSTKDRMLSVLPLAHSYECGLGLLAPFFSGCSVSYLDRPPSPSVLLPAVKLIRPTAMVAVPLLIEKIYNNGIAPKLRVNKLYKFPLTRPLAVWVAGRKLIKALGGKIRFFGLGGAPLGPEVEKFLYKSKFPYTIGYGLTEAAPLVAGNAPFGFTLKSGLGAPKGVKIRVEKCPTLPNSTEGEIQLTGPNVMMGYYKDKERTAEVFTEDGWLRTGDLGHMIKDRLYIRGRLKALILGPSGENIYPEEIEGLLGSSQLVEDALVKTGDKGEIIAIIRLSEAAKNASTVLENSLEELRSWVNKKLAAFSRISRIEIRHEPFEKTPTMKIKRYLYV